MYMQDQSQPLAQQVWDCLKQIIEPSYHINLVDLGLIYDVVIQPHQIVKVAFALTDKGGEPTWIDKMRQEIERLPGIGGVDLELITSPLWSRSKMSKLAAKQSGTIFSGGSYE